MAAGGVLVGRGYVSIRPEFEGDWSRQVNARASSAGRSGGGAFSKAFGGAVSGGLRGIVGGFGTSLAAGIAPAGAAVAALAPALATAATAGAALKLGLSGVGEAFKAAFADSSAQASSAASATKAVESAQRGLANAQRGLAQARVDAAKRVQDAQRGVADAERDLVDAQRDARAVQGELNDARREAARTLEDMNQRLAESHLDERDAVLRLKEAEKELKAAQAKPGTDPADLERLQLAYDRAALNLQEQQRDTKRLAADTAKANKAGVEGSEQVVAAKERIAEANRGVADRERALADAQRGVAEARADGQRQVEDAQRAVADAAAAVADAQSAAAAQTSKFDEAMSKLAPNAQSFVRAVQGLAPAWDSMRLSVQNALFEGLDGTVRTLGEATIPVLQKRLTETGGIWNQIAKSAAGAVTDMARSGMLDQILAGANDNLRVFKDTPRQLITAFGQLTVAAQPAFNGLMQGFAGAIESATGRLGAAFESGSLKTAIDTAFTILGQLGGVLGDALGAVGNIMKAASDAGGQALAVVGELFAELRRITAMPEVQAALRTIFASIAQIAAAIAPVFGAVVQAVVPLLAEIAPVVAQLAQVLGPALTQAVGLIGEALLSIMQSLDLSAIVGDLTAALMPLLGIAVELVPVAAEIVAAFGPSLVAVFAALGQVLVTLTPLIRLAAGLLTAALVPVARIAAGVVTALANAIASGARWLQQYGLWLAPAAVLVGALTLAMNLQRIATAATVAVFAVYRGLIVATTAVTRAFTVVQAALNVVLRANPIGLVITALLALGAGVVAAYKKSETFRRIVQGAWRGIQEAAKFAWNGVLKPTFSALKGGVESMGRTFRRLRDDYVRPVWNGIKGVISSVWQDGIRPSFDAVRRAVGKIGDAFDAARKAIKTAWDKVKKIARDPIQYVVDIVYNKGIVGVWNKVATAFGADPLKEFHFARGGIMPGYTPGRDVHNFVSSTGGRLALSGGEAIMRPEFTRAVGSGFVHSMNAIARSRGAEGVRAALAPVFGGNPPAHTDRSLRYAAGGVVQRFADGGIFSWIGKAASKVAGAGSAVWNKIKEGAAWLKDTLAESALSGVRNVVDPLLKNFPGMDTKFGKAIRGIPTKMIKWMFGYSKDADKKGGSGLGGPKIKAATRWAKAQAGKPYIWGGVGPKGFDCSGFMGAIENVIRGQKPNSRRWATGAFHGKTAPPGWVKNGNSAFRVGITNAGVGHTAGTIGKTKVESRGGDGVVVGSRARGYNSRLFTDWYGFKPGTYDSGGFLRPGMTAAYNGTGKPEAVLTDGQWRTMTAAAAGGSLDGMSVNVWVGNEQIRDITRAEVRDSQQQLISVLNAG